MKNFDCSHAATPKQMSRVCLTHTHSQSAFCGANSADSCKKIGFWCLIELAFRLNFSHLQASRQRQPNWTILLTAFSVTERKLNYFGINRFSINGKQRSSRAHNCLTRLAKHFFAHSNSKVLTHDGWQTFRHRKIVKIAADWIPSRPCAFITQLRCQNIRVIYSNFLVFALWRGFDGHKALEKRGQSITYVENI